MAAQLDPHQLGCLVAHQIATHCEPALEHGQARAHGRRFLLHRREADGSLHGRLRFSRAPVFEIDQVVPGG